MNRLLRLLLPLLAALGSVAVVRGAESVPSDEAELKRELQRLLDAAQPRWNTSVSASVSAGYKDNLLLSFRDPESSAFGRLSIESLLWHVPRGNIDYFGFVNAEGTRYFSGRSVEDESEAFAGLTWRYRRADVVNVTLDTQGYYLDQVLDISDTDTERVVAELGVYGIKAGPTVRWAPLKWLWAEANVMGTRELFREGVHNAKIGEGAFRLGWSPGERLEVSAVTSLLRRRFDTRPRYTAGGRVDTGILAIRERETEARVVTKLGKTHQWKSTTRAGVMEYRDNGAGYLDYDSEHVAQRVEWAGAVWSIQADAEARRKEYLLQTVGTGVAPPRQVVDEYLATLRIERKLNERWTAFVEASWERSRSNDEVSSYRVNEGLLGVRWSWDK